MTGNARSSMKRCRYGGADIAARRATRWVNASRTKSVRGNAIRELKKRDNFTNFVHIGRVYLVIIVAISCAIWSYGRRLGWSRVVVEHSGDPCCNRRHRSISTSVRRRHPRRHALHPVRQQKTERAYLDWLAAFPIYTSTFQFRLASPGASPVHQRPCARSRLRAAPR